MKVEDIKDKESLEAWLKPRPQADANAIAHRAALRVMPQWMSAMDQPWARKADLTALPILRQNLTSGVARCYPTPEVKNAAAAATYATNAATNAATYATNATNAAAYAATYATNAATNAATYATTAATATNAATTAAYATYATAVAATATAAFWKQIQWDAQQVEAGQDLLDALLWTGAPPDWFTDHDQKSRALWSANPAPWSFWLRWWDGVISGHPLDWKLQEAVALIPDEVWKQGPEMVAEAIRKIEAAFDAQAEPDPIEQSLVALPSGSQEIIQRFSDAVAQYHEDIPPTFEALLEFCSREIERLQGRNAPYANIEEEMEAQRQIRVLTTIYATLEKLCDTIPADGILTDKAAERGEKLSRLFVRSFKEWPRKNAEDIVDSTYRAALVGLTATLAPMIGISVGIAVGAGVVVFGGKKVADGIKAIKDLKDLAP